MAQLGDDLACQARKVDYEIILKIFNYEIREITRKFKKNLIKGHGFLEAVYQECLAIEFSEQKIPYIEQPRLQLSYKNTLLKQEYEPDFICFDKVIIEIKAVKQLSAEHRAQTINYLKATGFELGLLVNFGHYPKVEHERFVNQIAG